MIQRIEVKPMRDALASQHIHPTYEEPRPAPVLLETDEAVPIWRKMALSLDEAAALIGVSRPHLERFVASGDLATIHIGKRVLVKPTTLQQFLDNHEN